MRKALFIFLILSSIVSLARKTDFELSNGSRSVTYKELIAFYRQLDQDYSTIKMEQVGPTDAYYPLHVVYYSNDASFDIRTWKDQGKIVILINNGIHPGEPDGIDASMMLLRDAAEGKLKIPDNIALAVIPVFNIGGMLNRCSYSRANQDGPEEYGFRGNSKNLDLNRDFIKMDAKETRSLVKLFHRLDPDVFIDNHVSDGADYQHVMTLLPTLHDKLGGSMASYMRTTFESLIYADMKNRGYDLVPYVNHWGHTPDKGWISFYDGPRFMSGFAALFHTYAFVTETHMLKPFKQRVDATYAMMQSFISFSSVHADEITATRKEQKKYYSNATKLSIAWQVDTAHHTTITFKGYEAGYKPSLVSGQPRLFYDRSKPYTKQIPLHDSYTPTQSASVPKAYIVGHGWTNVINRLKINGVKMDIIPADTTILITANYIDDYETVKKPYEGHYLHSNIKVHAIHKEVRVLKGDYVISTNQPAKRYILETLEPTAPDGFFAWGFFDAILQQKEGYSDYVFEDEAAELLKQNPELKQLLKERQKADSNFVTDGVAQLDFVYKHSPYFESTYGRYPVFRIE